MEPEKVTMALDILRSSEKSEKENAELRLLLERFLAGDGGAFDEIVTRWRPIIRSLVRSYCRDEGLAEDVVAEVFYPTFYNEILKRGTEVLKSPKAFLWKIATTRGINEWWREERERMRTTALHPGEELNAVDNPAQSVERLESLQAAFDQLPPQEREAVILRDVEGLEYEAIAVVMAAPLGSVKGWIYRGRRHLRAALGSPKEK